MNTKKGRKPHALYPNPSIKKTNSIKKILKKYWPYLAIFITITTAYLKFRDEIARLLITKHELYKKENFIPGIIFPKAIADDDSILIGEGGFGFKYKVGDLKKGVNYVAGFTSTCSDNKLSNNLFFKIKQDNKLYFSYIFNDIETKMPIGQIIENKWELFAPNIFDYHTDDNSLEVLDRHRQIVLSLQITDGNKVLIQGYFVGDKYITVIDSVGVSYCFDKYDEKLKISISQIRPVHFKDGGF